MNNMNEVLFHTLPRTSRHLLHFSLVPQLSPQDGLDLQVTRTHDIQVNNCNLRPLRTGMLPIDPVRNISKVINVEDLLLELLQPGLKSPLTQVPGEQRLDVILYTSPDVFFSCQNSSPPLLSVINSTASSVLDHQKTITSSTANGFISQLTTVGIGRNRTRRGSILMRLLYDSIHLNWDLVD
jgi:hypothetical protein